MEKIKAIPVLTRDDYTVIINNLNSSLDKHKCTQQEAEKLVAEIKKAKLVDNDEIDPIYVRLNSIVVIKDEANGKEMQLTLVTPHKADIKQRKISVFSPIGAALIGYAKGESVAWTVPTGEKTFTILDVINNFP